MITAAIASVAYGATMVVHSSGAVILTGKAGYIAGSLGGAIITTLYALPF